MGEKQQPTAERYCEMAEEIRGAALRMQSPEIREQLLNLAECYEHLAALARRRDPRRV